MEKLVGVWMEEYRARQGEIQSRIDLQHRNANIHTVIISAIIGYAITLLGQQGVAEFASSEFILLLPAACLISAAFMIRHIDHEANIVDSAQYTNRVIRPNIKRLTGGNPLRWEDFLKTSRPKRLRWFGGAAFFGSDLTLIFIVAMPFLALGWLAFVYVPGHAGTMQLTYNVLLIVDTLLFFWAILGNFLSQAGYSEITKPLD